MQGRGRAQRESCVNTRREEGDAGRFATYSVQAPRRQVTATYHRGLPARESCYREDGAQRGLSEAGDKEARRQNKLQSLPLTRIAGRDSPKPLCMADLSARRQGKSLLRISRRTRTCRPASRGNAWALACSCLTSPCFPLRPGRFAEQIRP